MSKPTITMLRISFCLFIALLWGFGASAQTLSGVSTRWSDSFVEWEVFAWPETTGDEENQEKPDEEKVGEFKQRWGALRDDWSEWDYELFGERGTIRVKWKDDPTHWELRSETGQVITMRTTWGKNLNDWRVTDNDFALSLQSRWTNQLDDWQVDDRNRGTFQMRTLRRGDPRDWDIDDRLSEEVSLPMKTALIFLVFFHSSPRM